MMDTQQAADESRIRLETRFGTFEADAASLITFPLGIPGFEACRRFVILSSADYPSLQCLHAVSGPAASFLTVDPRFVLDGYRCILSASDHARLGVDDGDDLLWLAITTMDEAGAAWANLRAPVVVNPATMTGFQVMPQDSLYPLRHPVTIG